MKTTTTRNRFPAFIPATIALVLAGFASVRIRRAIKRGLWTGAILAAGTVSSESQFVLSRYASSAEYQFKAPNGPLIWDFSGWYSWPFSTTLYQHADGGFVSDFGWQGQVTENYGSVGMTLSLSFSTGDYWRNCEASLTLNQEGRLLTGLISCASVTPDSWYTNFTVEPVSLPLRDGADGQWKLRLDTVSAGTQILGAAAITLSSSNALQFQITGTNTTVTKSVMTLQNLSSSRCFLNIVTLGPEMTLQSMHGKVAGQSVDYEVPATLSHLSLWTHGNGAVKLFTNGQALVDGQDYRLTAMARPGNLFSNWIVAGIVVTDPTLRFTMCSNLVITANFVTNRFLAAAGVYSGLFFETNGVEQHSAGFFTLSLTSQGRFSGKLTLDGGKHSFTGGFDPAGQAQLGIKRGRKAELSVLLELDSVNREIRGSVTDGSWVAELSGDHAFSRSASPTDPYGAVYTMVIPGSSDSDAVFVGDGYTTLWIDYYGTIRMSGALADDTRISQAIRISEEGRWPLYIPLYGGKGFIMSWITFSNQPAVGLGGNLVWIKPAMPASKLYPAGLTNETSAGGSSFWSPGPSNGRLQLNFTNGVLILAGGNLPVALTNTLGNSSGAMGPTRFNLKWNLIDGLVSGSFLHPATGNRASVKGVVLQDQSVARGYFLGTNQSGLFVWRQQLAE